MSQRVIWLGVGGALTVVALLLGMASVWAVVQETSTETERQSETYQRAASGIEVDLTTGDVSIAGQGADRVDVERTIEWSRAEPTIDETWTGDTLGVDVECPNGFPMWVGAHCQVDYAARIPYAAAVDVDTTTGPIDLTDLAGDVEVVSTTGDVTGTDLRSERLAATVTTGDLDLRFTEAPDAVSIDVTTGDIVLELPRGGAYDVDVETTTGDAQVDVVQDPSAAHSITVRAATADVWIRYAG